MTDNVPSADNTAPDPFALLLAAVRKAGLRYQAQFRYLLPGTPALPPRVRGLVRDDAGKLVIDVQRLVPAKTPGNKHGRHWAHETTLEVHDPDKAVADLLALNAKKMT